MARAPEARRRGEEDVMEADEIWVLDHDGHDVVEKDEHTFHCNTCDVDIPKEPPKGELEIDGSLEIEDGVDIEIGIKKSF